MKRSVRHRRTTTPDADRITSSAEAEVPGRGRGRGRGADLKQATRVEFSLDTNDAAHKQTQANYHFRRASTGAA